MPTESCFICKAGSATTFTDTDGQLMHSVNCPVCGFYRIQHYVVAVHLQDSALTPTQRVLISHFLRNSHNFYLTRESFPDLLNLPLPPVADRADRLLQFLAKRDGTPGHTIRLPLRDPRIWTELQSADEKDFGYLLTEYLGGEGYVRSSTAEGNDVDIRILPPGWRRIQQLADRPTDEPTGFVAMWFDDSTERLRDEALIPGIRDAGYAAVIVNRTEHVNRIDDEIVALIRRSRFLVADFAGDRGGVYFEAGFAKGLGLPVFWTCPKATLDAHRLHFDVEHYNFLDWDDTALPELRRRLAVRIEAVIGRGSVRADAA